MQYVLLHEYDGGIKAHPFVSKSENVLAHHEPEDIARVLGVNFDPGTELLSVAAIRADPVDFDALLTEVSKVSPGK